MKKIERYSIFEISVRGHKPSESNVEVDIIATFTNGDKSIRVKGFYNGDSQYMVRFMPTALGIWHYEINLRTQEVINEVGDFECALESGTNHGPVVANGTAFHYSDGTRYRPFGTTVYAWIHQPQALIDKTITTLEKSPFNKVRMCVFPKSMEYNHNEPELFPFEKDQQGQWDVHQPNFEFWKQLECHLKVLMDFPLKRT